VRLPWLSKPAQEEDPYWDFFLNTAPDDLRNSLVATIRNAPEGAINPVKEDIHTPEVMARHVKELGAYVGADLVGIARTEREDYPFAVLIAMRAAWDPRASPGIGGQLPLQKGLFVSFVMSAWLRELGYKGTVKEPVDNDALAVRAGMGTLDGDGRLVSPRLGPVYVSDAILTDLPLEADG
jgi:hypothetical protein